MSNEDCPNCSGHTQLDCLRDYFGGTLAELLRDTLEKVRAVTQEAELVEDMVSLMSSFSAKVYGKRSAENRKKKKAEAA